MRKPKPVIVETATVISQVPLTQDAINALGECAAQSGKTWQDFLPFVALMQTVQQVSRMGQEYARRQTQLSEIRKAEGGENETDKNT